MRGDVYLHVDQMKLFRSEGHVKKETVREILRDTPANQCSFVFLILPAIKIMLKNQVDSCICFLFILCLLCCEHRAVCNGANNHPEQESYTDFELHDTGIMFCVYVL